MLRKLTKISFDRLGSERPRQTSQIEIPFLQRQPEVFEPAKYVNQITKLGDVTNSKTFHPKTAYQKLCTYLQLHFPAINPESEWLLCWDLLNILIILYNFIQIPIFIFITDYYSLDYYSNTLLFVDIGFILIFFIDLLAVRSRIAYLQKEILVTSYFSLYENYLKTGFIWDLISLLSLVVYVCVPSVIYIKIIFIFKMYTMVKINMQIQNSLFPYIIILSFYKFLKLVAFIFLVTSFCACIYFTIDYYYYLQKGKYYYGGFLWLTGSQTTFDMNLIQIFEWPVWYDYALYWSVQTTAGVGYGNMTPRNSPEVLLCNLVMLTTLCMFSYFTDGIIDIITQLQQYDLKRQQKMSELNRYIYQNDVQNESKKKTKFYINSYIRKNYHQIRVSLEQSLSFTLTTSFRLVYTLQLTHNLPIMKTLFFNSDNWTIFAKEIIGYLKVNHQSTGDQISGLFQNNSFKLGVIVKGYATAYNSILQYQKVYNEWEYFGQRQFFFGGQTLSELRCKTFTKYYYLQRQDFFRVIKNYTQQNQILSQLVDAAMINARETPQFGNQCMLCDKYHHQRFCPINSKWRERIYLKSNKYSLDQQQRKSFNRNNLSSDKMRDIKHPKMCEIVRTQDFKHFYVIYNISKGQI